MKESTIGFVQSSEGAARVVSVDGTIRGINPGDPIFEGDTLSDTGSSVVILFANGSVRQVSSGDLFQIDGVEVFDVTETPEFQDLLDALNAGEDISEDQEPTEAGEVAAGGDSNGGGLVFALTGFEVTPTAGIDPDYTPPPLPDPTADTDVNRSNEAVIVGVEPPVEPPVENDIPLFTLVNDGDDLDSIVTISTLNPDADTTYINQFTDWEYGDDGFGSINLTLPDNVQVESKTENQVILNLYEGDDIVGVLTLNADGTDSLVVVSREGDTVFTSVTATSAKAGGPVGSLLVELDDFNIIISGSDGDDNPNEVGSGHAGDDLVNTSNKGWAVKGDQGQTNQEGESILFSFVRDDTPYAVNDFKFTTEGYTRGITDADITVKVFTSADLTAWDEISLNVTSGQVVQISEYTSADVIYGVEVISAESEGWFRVNGIEVGDNEYVPPADLSFVGIGIEIIDTDGDTDYQRFDVYIDGDSGDNISVEAIVGTSGDDVLMSTPGNDILMGGPGADIFQWYLGDEGVDTVVDYNIADGDVLDLSDLLVGEDTLDSTFLTVTSDGIDTTIDVGGDTAQSIVIEGVDMTNAGVLTSVDVIDSLLASNSLIIE